MFSYINRTTPLQAPVRPHVVELLLSAGCQWSQWCRGCGTESHHCPSMATNTNTSTYHMNCQIVTYV